MKTLRSLLFAIAVVLLCHSCSADEPKYPIKVDMSYIGGNDGVLSVLAIGNSFSQDAVEGYLLPIFREQGVEVHLANAHIGGASFDTHIDAIRHNKRIYRFWEGTTAVNATDTKGQCLDSILRSAPWDIITIQQVSQSAGRYETYRKKAPELIAYIRERAPYDARILFHQTWAYDAEASDGNFANFKSQQAMYDAIIDATNRALDELEIDGIIPCGRAIQYARELYPELHFTRDGFHLNKEHGRYTASCTWYEALTGFDANEIEYVPRNLDSNIAEGLRAVAHRANKENN